MQKKSIFTILGIMLAVVVASLSLVFAVGPRVGADSEVVLNQESHFKINGSHQLTGISDAGNSLINGKNFRIEIPSSVTSIGEWAISDCNLTTVTFAENSQLTSIGDGAFYYCSGLTTIEIPSSVTSIGNRAFYGCSGLTTIDCTAFESKPDGWDDGWLGNCDPSIVQWCPLVFTLTNNDTEYAVTGYRGTPTEIIIPAEWNGKPVTSIGDYAFYECSGLTTVTFAGNSQLTSIGEWAFCDCSGLTSIEIPSSVTSIGDAAFASCSGLTSIEIPSSVTWIGNDAFFECSGLTSIEIPSGVTSIGGWAFASCSGLTSIDCTAFESKPDGWNDGWLGNCDPSIVQWCPLVFTLTNNDTEYAVTGYRGTSTEIIIPAEWNGKPVTSIGVDAFLGCSGLTSIEIPSSVTSIGGDAFFYCSGLTTVTFAGNSQLTSIGNDAFLGCSGLTSIEIPSSVTSIGDCAFYECSGLTTITFTGNSQLASIGGSAFAECSGLTSITIPSGVTSIGANSFYGCSGLTQIIVENPDLMLNPNLQRYQNILHCTVTCTVNFSVEGIVIDSQEIEYGKNNIELPVVPIKKGYYIVDWYRDAGYNEAFDYSPITEDLTLYAMWEPITVTVVFNTVYGIIRTDYYTIGDTDLAHDVPELDGYEFCYWYRFDDFRYCYGDEWIFGHEPECLTPFDFNAGITSENVDWNYPYIYLLPKYEIKWVTVNFDSNGGSTVDSVTLQSGATLSMSKQPTLEHYNFQYWYLTDENEPFFEDTAITNNITLHAKWAVSSYSVIFNPRNGDEATVESVVYQGTVTQPADPSKSGHTFQGWYTDAECTQAYTFGDEVTGNITLYAKWKAEICTVTFSINGVESSQSVEYGQTVTMDIPTQDGYTFIGWYTQNNVLFSLDTPITSDINLHAVWGINYFIVTFMDDGSVINRQNVNVNSKVVKPTDPMQAGYVFDGWYTDESLENAYDFDNVVTNNFTLYAKWIEDVPVETEPESTGVDKHNNNVTIAAIAGGVGAGVVCVGGTILAIVLKKRRKL